MLPDITALGKVIGGGLPVGGVRRARRLMERMAPAGDVYQAGTLSGNPLAMAAGIAMLRRHRGTRRGRTRASRSSGHGCRPASSARPPAAGVALSVARVGSVLTPFFRGSPPGNYDEARESDTAAFASFHAAMLDRGVLLPPSQFEAWFVSLAHDEAAIDATIEAARAALAEVAAGQ